MHKAMYNFTDFEPEKGTPAHEAWYAMRKAWLNLGAEGQSRPRARGRRMRGLSERYWKRYGNIQAKPRTKYTLSRGGGKTREVVCLRVECKRRWDAKVLVADLGRGTTLWVSDVDLTSLDATP